MHEDIRYEKHFLKEVIMRIDFVAPLDELTKSLPQKVVKVASQQFPIAEPTEGFTEQLELRAGELHHQRKMHFKQWNFFGKEREKHLVLAAPFMFIAFARYTKYEALRDTLTAIVDAVAKRFPDARAGRFGLRYINNIEIEGLAPAAWGEYIAPDLVGARRFLNQPEHLTWLFHSAELKYADLDVRFQFGLPNPDYPAVMKRPLFVLDYDGYVRTAHDLGESLQNMEKAHERIKELFEKSITPKLRERMNAVPTLSVQ